MQDPATPSSKPGPAGDVAEPARPPVAATRPTSVRDAAATQPDPRREELLDEVVAALPAWQVLVVQFNDRVAARMGVSASDLQCLWVLSHYGPSTPGAIAIRIDLSTGATSRMIDRLLVAGLVTRSPDPRDRRRVIVEPTAAALEQVAEHYIPLNTELRRHLEDIDDGALRSMLKFVHAAEATTERAIRGELTP